VKTKTEYSTFEKLADKILSVPHSEIKDKLEAEKKAKKEKNRKTNKKNG
jgi:hypothetical protein